MKKLISAFLFLVFVLCLSTAAFADDYTQNFADLYDMAEYVESNGLDIALTEQFFVVDTTASSNYKFELSASGQAVEVFFCVLTRGTELSDYGLADNVYLVKRILRRSIFQQIVVALQRLSLRPATATDMWR